MASHITYVFERDALGRQERHHRVPQFMRSPVPESSRRREFRKFTPASGWINHQSESGRGDECRFLPFDPCGQTLLRLADPMSLK
jgi:hypothetical protein